ncbi:hypothetical protein ABPG74_014272 [Tetrahymena malaccensis]
MTDIPLWLIEAHRENLFALQNCINNPSEGENKLAIEMYKTLLSHDSGFSDFKYIILNEWIVNPKKPWKGKGDLVFTNGKNILVVEVKRIKSSNKYIKLQQLTKVIRQARYYALMIMKFRDKQRFPISEYNKYFRKSKIHAAFYTNLDKNIILVKHPKRISSRNKQRLIDLPRNLTTYEVINTNKLNVELVEEQTPVHQKLLSSQVKIEENQAQQQNIQLKKKNSHQQQQYLAKQPKYNILEESKDNEIIFLNHKTNILNTPKNKIKSSDSTLKKFDDILTIKTDSKNRKFLIDSNNWDQKELIDISSEEHIDSKKQIIIDDTKKQYYKNKNSAQHQNYDKNDIIFLNEIKPYKKQTPDLIFLNSIQNQIQIPIQSEPPKIIPFNMSLALQKNFDINCSLSQLNAPQQQKQVTEDDYCDVSLYSFIDVASFDLDNSYVQINNNNDTSSRQQKLSSNLLGALNDNQHLHQPLKDIVQQKLYELKDHTQISNNLNKKDKGLSQLDKIIIEDNDILVGKNDSNKENNQKLISLEEKEIDFNFQMQIQKKDLHPEQIQNNQTLNQDQEIISECQKIINEQNTISADFLKTDSIQQNNNLDNQNNMQEQQDNLIKNLTEDNQENKLNQSQYYQNNQQIQSCQDDSFYQFMLQQILIQEQIQEMQNEEQIQQEENKVMLDVIDEQILPSLTYDKSQFQTSEQCFSTYDNTITVNKLNTQNVQQIDTLSEQKILQTNSDNSQNQEKRKFKKIIKVDKNKCQEKLSQENNNLNCNKDKIIDQSQKSYKIIKILGIPENKGQQCSQLQVVPQQEQSYSNSKYLEESNYQNKQDINLLKSSSPSMCLNFQDKIDKKIKIVKPDEIFKGKKINIVYRQPCREKKQKFIEIL